MARVGIRDGNSPGRRGPAALPAQLAEYAAKRDAARSNEPAGTEPALSPGNTRAGRFVVHLHRARRTHYDLRLEVGGVLKSFAVPRGPSLDPADRRLAIETENHPLEYLQFEAVIPAGNYGAGPMALWDSGRVRYLEQAAEPALAAGKLDFELWGFKLRGRFALVRVKGRAAEAKPSWLLLKKQDAYSREDRPVLEAEPRSVLSGLLVDELDRAPAIAAVAEARAAELGAPLRSALDRFEPMPCSESPEAVLVRPGWIYELKLDGVRLIADKRGGQVALWSRRGASVTVRYPEIARAVRALPADQLILDGEIVAFDASGRPSFSRLARRMHVDRPASVEAAVQEVPVSYLVFDVLAVGERDLMPLPLVERKSILAELVQGHGWVRRLDHLEADGRPLYDFCRRERLEGVVAKRGAAAYRPGPRRTGDWVKVKCERDDEFVVVGVTRGRGARDKLGAIDVASYEGERLVVRGKVGSGFDERTIGEVLARLHGTERATCAAEGTLEPAPQGRTFVEPTLVVSVRYLGWTDPGRLRFPVFRGIRDEVGMHECTAAPRPAPTGPEPPAPCVASDRVTISNRRKVFWPGEGITKGQLCDYYAELADALLPYLHDRPVVLVRYPDGIEGPHFYQWHAPPRLPSWVRTLPVRHGERWVDGFLVNDRDTLSYVANLGAIPIHILASRSGTLEYCDFLTFDLDVRQSTLADAIVIARSLHDLIDQVGLRAYPKTSGQSGLHVLVPLGPAAKYETARLLVELLGRVIQRRHPELATMQRSVEQRGQRVYVDTVQTGETRTIVAPYSVRAVPGAVVSTPLAWDEVTAGLEPRNYTLASVPARWASRGDPMRSLLDDRPDIGRALGALEVIVRSL